MRTDKQKQNSLKLVLFDIDQTLINNGGAGRKALYKALQDVLQIDLKRPELAKIKMSGKTDPQIVKEFVLASGLTEDAKDEAYWQKIISQTIDKYLDFLPIEIDAAAGSPEYFMHEGVLEILQALEDDERVYLGLLTGNVEKGARIKLARFNLNGFFPIGAFGCDSANRLDLPAVAHKRAQTHYGLSIEPEQIVIIGDAENDVLCAKHYGATSLAVNTGSTTWQELSALEPDYLFPSLKDTKLVVEAICAQTAGKIFI